MISEDKSKLCKSKSLKWVRKCQPPETLKNRASPDRCNRSSPISMTRMIDHKNKRLGVNIRKSVISLSGGLLLLLGCQLLLALATLGDQHVEFGHHLLRLFQESCLLPPCLAALLLPSSQIVPRRPAERDRVCASDTVLSPCLLRCQGLG